MRELERDLVPSPDATLAVVGADCVGWSLARAAERARIVVELIGHEQLPDSLAAANAALLRVPEEVSA